MTDRVAEWLVRDLGGEHVFKDVDSIPLEQDFRNVIRDAVTRCDALLVILGREWLSARGSTGTRRIDDPGDWVRIEIEAALERDIPIIPLFVNGATPPRVSELPEKLRGFAYRNGMPVRPDPDFRGDIERLIRTLKAIKPTVRRAVRKPARPEETVVTKPLSIPISIAQPEAGRNVRMSVFRAAHRRAGLFLALVLIIGATCFLFFGPGTGHPRARPSNVPPAAKPEGGSAPRVTSMSLDYQFPDYTGLPMRKDVAERNVDALEGTKITVKARTNVPGVSAYIDLSPGQENINSQMDESQSAPNFLVGSFTVIRSGRYTIRLNAGDGPMNVEPVAYQIKSNPDLLPIATFLWPNEPVFTAPNNARIPVEMKALDDFGVMEATLNVRQGDETLYSVDLLKNKPAAREFREIFVVDLAAKKVNPGARVEYSLRVRDTKQPWPHLVKSAPQIIKVVAPFDEKRN